MFYMTHAGAYISEDNTPGTIFRMQSLFLIIVGPVTMGKIESSRDDSP